MPKIQPWRGFISASGQYIPTHLCQGPTHSQGQSIPRVFWAQIPSPIHAEGPSMLGPIYPEDPWASSHAQGPSILRAHPFPRPIHLEGPWDPIHAQGPSLPR